MPLSALNPTESPKPAIIIYTRGRIAKNINNNIRLNLLILLFYIVTYGRAWNIIKHKTSRRSAAKNKLNEIS